MPKRGDIVIERLTGKRAIVIRIDGDEVTCRFADGRLDDRFVFELELAMPFVESVLSVVFSLFGATSTRERWLPAGVAERGRPILVRPAS
jgi:hypothetical protein